MIHNAGISAPTTAGVDGVANGTKRLQVAICHNLELVGLTIVTYEAGVRSGHDMATIMAAEPPNGKHCAGS